MAEHPYRTAPHLPISHIQRFLVEVAPSQGNTLSLEYVQKILTSSDALSKATVEELDPPPYAGMHRNEGGSTVVDPQHVADVLGIDNDKLPADLGAGAAFWLNLADEMDSSDTERVMCAVGRLLGYLP